MATAGQGPLVSAVSPEGPLRFVAFCDKPGALRTLSNPNPHRIPLMSDEKMATNKWQ